MTSENNDGYAVETEEGELIPVKNFATAQYLINNGVGKRILDLVLNKYLK
jgi:hypothetical protein